MALAPAAVPYAAGSATRGTADDARQATAILGDLKAGYRYLDGVTVSMGRTPHGEEAVAYYTEGRIVISPTHSADIATILRHEIWHVIDWRDNRRLDWAENLPPGDSYRYARR